MSLVSLKNIYYSVGAFPLLDYVNLDIAPKERIALIGRNGEGKSTLLKILSQTIQPESGEIIKSRFVSISRLEQELPALEEVTVFEAVARGLADLSNLLIQYHDLALSENHDDTWFAQIGKIQQEIEAKNGWQIQQRIESVISALSLPENAKLSELSGGWRRRVALGAALVQEPDVLLLDEPTNHLDIAAIEWLEKLLLNYPKTLIFITHDRALLRKIATKIVELDRGKLTAYPADYDQYLQRKEQALLEEERHNALFDKKLSEEEEWIRQGIKARRTRNEGRVRALKALREQRSVRREFQNKPKFEVNKLTQSGQIIIQAEKLAFGYNKDKTIISDFTFNIQRGDKIAIVGPNGSGKTTLIRLLLGLEQPTSGTIKRSPTLLPAFFDQNRAQLVGSETAMSNVTEGDDYIEINGKKRHVVGYLSDFLFSPKKCRTLAKDLSGGEQNRLLLAKLFSKPANVLVLDEPTNDLDVETLDVLENLLLNYEGTVIVISHDREFIDNIATHCIAFEENGKLSINVGGYSDWLVRQVPVEKAMLKESTKKEQTKVTKSTDSRKLSYHEQRELETLPLKIEKLEQEIAQLQQAVCEPDFYQKPQAEIQKTNDKLKELDRALAAAYAKWESLEE